MMTRSRLLALCAVVVLSGSPAARNGVQALNVSPLDVPADRVTSLVVGPVTVTTYNPVTITPLEYGTTLSMSVRNTSTQAVTLQFTSWSELLSTRPTWMLFLFKLFGNEQASQPATIRLSAGETQTLSFYMTRDNVSERRVETQLPFRFRVVESGDQGTLTLTIVGDDRTRDFFKSGTKSAVLAGRVTSTDGRPIAGALVNVAFLNNRIPSFRNLFEVPQEIRTDADGRYRVSVFSVAELQAGLGDRPRPYGAPDYFLTAEASGYALAHRSGVAPATGQTLTIDWTLQTSTQSAAYSMVGELATDGKQSYWWMRFAGNGDRVVSIQGQHSPELHIPGHIIAVDLTARELWRVPTGDECWGLDVSTDGHTIGAACHDGFLYLVSDDGRLLFKVQVASPAFPRRAFLAGRQARGGRGRSRGFCRGERSDRSGCLERQRRNSGRRRGRRLQEPLESRRQASRHVRSQWTDCDVHEHGAVGLASERRSRTAVSRARQRLQHVCSGKRSAALQLRRRRQLAMAR